MNATFGNAPELIVALVAVSNGLPDVVRASLVGSIAGNLLLVLGFTLLVGRAAEIDSTSARISLAQIAFATLLVLVRRYRAYTETRIAVGSPTFHSRSPRRSCSGGWSSIATSFAGSGDCVLPPSRKQARAGRSEPRSSYSGWRH